MNARTIVLCVLFLTFGLIAKAADSSPASTGIPGGIVYSNGKDAIFLDFKTGKTFNLTADTNNAVVKPPFAASENGKQLLWLQDSKFQSKELPLAVPQAIQADTMKTTKIVRDPNSPNPKSITKRPGKKEDIIWQREVKNLSLSPDGARFAFEATHAAPSWFLIDQGNPNSVARAVAAGIDPGKNDMVFNVLPLYAKRGDSFNGIFYLSTRYNQYNPPSADPFTPVFGNTVERPPVALFKATHQDLGIRPLPGDFGKPLGHGLLGTLFYGGETMGGQLPAPQNIYSTQCTKKNACFLTFQKLQAWESGAKKAAFIYQIGNQWGPIEIQTLDEERLAGVHDYYNCRSVKGFFTNDIPENYQGKAREMEIQIAFPSVIGLAWKPDGSLSVFTGQGDVYLVKGEDIQNAFNSSSTELVRDKNDRKQVNPQSVNNILQPKLELVAKGITGTCFNWVSDYSLLYLGRDNNVHLWTQGKTEKIADSIGEFCYCSRSPFEGVKNPEALSASTAGNESNNPPAVSGTSKASEGSSYNVNAKGWPEDAKINFGPIQTAWRQHGKDAVVMFLKLNRDGGEKQPPQFALTTDEDNLDNIKDPSQYEFLSGQKRWVSVPNEKDKRAYQIAYQKQLKQSSAGQRVTGNLAPFIHNELKICDRDVVVPLDAIIILKFDTAYVAIKPVSLGLKYKSIEEIPKSEYVLKIWIKEYTEAGKVPPIYDSMTYEWKYWPKVVAPNGTTAKKAEKNKNWEISAVPIGKEFYIGGTKFVWKDIPEKQPSSAEQKQRFVLEFVSSYENRNEYIGSFRDSLRTSVFDPSRYEFQNCRHDVDTTAHYFEEPWWENEDHVLVLKIGEKHIAIQPVEEKQGWIQYKWRYWPAIKPQELAKTALNK